MMIRLGAKHNLVKLLREKGEGEKGVEGERGWGRGREKGERERGGRGRVKKGEREKGEREREGEKGRERGEEGEKKGWENGKVERERSVAVESSNYQVTTQVTRVQIPRWI